VLYVMGHAGQAGSVRVAAVLNLTVSLLAFVAHRRSQRPQEVAEAIAQVGAE
jgi:hypothetical protein